MLCHVAVELGIGIYGILGDLGEVAEMTGDEVCLLNQFIQVIGYDSSTRKFTISVYRDYTDLGKAYYLLHCALCGRTIPMFWAVIKENIARGFWIPGDFGDCSEFSGYNVSLAMRFGVKASVTDTGWLTFLNTCDKDVIVLSDFCTSILENAVMPTDKTVFVFDDNLVSLPRILGRGTFNVDTKRVRGKNRQLLDRLLHSGRFREVGS